MAKILKHSDMQNSVHIIDRISSFPDGILDHILSSFPTKEAVQTCILSKRWTNLWRSVPCLDFQQGSINSSDFSTVVDSVLLHRDGTKLESLRLHYSDVNRNSVDSWISYAAQHNVEALDIDVGNTADFCASRLYICSSVEVLKLNLNRKTLIMPCLLSLKTLSLEDVILDCELDNVISFCPLLETLILIGCEFRDEILEMVSTQLKKLVIRGGVTKIEISAPGLQSLELSSYQHISVVAGTIDDEVEVPLLNLRMLKLETKFGNGEVEVINTLLKLSPNIETVIIKNIMGMFSWSPEKIEAVKMLKCELCHLKFVIIRGFEGSKNEVQFVKFIVENGVNLKQLDISSSDVHWKKSVGVIPKISKTLLTYPRVEKLSVDASRQRPASVSCTFI